MAGFNHLKFNSLIQEFIQKNKRENMTSISRNSSVNRQALTSYCNGLMVPGAEAIFKVAVYIGADIRDFFDWEKNYNYDSNTNILLVNSPETKYRSKNDSEAWHAAYDAQRQLTECKNELIETKQELHDIKLELEQTKKESVITRDAKAG